MYVLQSYYSKLNKEQKKAVDCIDGPLLVLAGPGTGKTQLLSVRAANIIKTREIDPSEILILTFTNAAAKTMRERLAAIIGRRGYEVEVETFHSFANSVILESEEAIGHRRNKIEISEVEKIRAIEYILDNVKGTEALRPFGAPYINRSEIETRISELKNEGISPERFKKELLTLKADGINVEQKHIIRLKALSSIYESYERLKDQDAALLFDERGRYDFDDMIYLALEALKQSPKLKLRFKERFKYIMVDEFQDTNGAQLDLLFSIVNNSGNVCCVGDDDQAIYRFQGATLDNFRRFSEKFSGAVTVSLMNNYRSAKEIIDLSARIIEQVAPEERMARKKLIPKKIYNSAEVSFLEFKTEEEELAYIIDRVEEQKKAIQEDENLTEEEKSAPYSNIAVLVRKRESIKKVINVFLKEGIPYATDGKEDIRQEKRVKQMMDVLELANTDIEDKEDRALLLYNVLASDYMRTDHTDLLKFISYVNDLRGKRYRARKSETDSLSAGKTAPLSLVEAFLDYFYPVNDEIPPKGSSLSDTLDLKAPGSLVRAAMAIGRMMKDSVTSTVHDLLLQYIEDVGLYKFILDSYETEKLIRIRELRGLVSFINMIKDASNSDPGLDLRGFVKQLDLRNIHGMPVTGKMATFNREGVRVFTAHASKGLEFHTVIIPFCLDRKNWPVKPRGQVVPLPPDIYKSKEKVKEKKMLKTLVFYDEIRLFYVASTRVRSNIIYTSTPRDKNISSSFLLDAGIKPRTKIFDEEDFLARYINVSKKEDFSASSTEKLLSGIVADMSLNPTSVGTYISCKRKFLYNDVLRLPGKKNQHLAFGNCVHEALENVYTVYKGKNIFPDFDYFKKVFKKELLFQGLKNSVINWCLDRLEGLEYWYRKESTDPVMPLELEQKIEIIFPQGFVFTGKFDKIEPGDAGIRVVDYKTGKPDKHIKSIHNCKDIFDAECDNYYRQLISYKLLYDRARGTRSGDRVTEGKLHFVEPVGESVKKYAMKKGDFFDIDIALRDDMAGDMERLISDIWAGIQSLDFRKLERRDGKGKCRICPYDSLCWG